MDYVGCACTVVMFTEHLGIRRVSAKIPQSSRARKVDRELRSTSRHTECATCLGRMERNVVGRDALGIRRRKLPQSTICEMQARNWPLEYGNCGSMALDDWRADLNTT